ncbi:MAG: tetratricopeptide repeat protein [Acidobacteriota bacterium]|nr:tetratricopeptide repeat protein [Acidobacteriota bacterium]
MSSRAARKTLAIVAAMMVVALGVGTSAEAQKRNRRDQPGRRTVTPEQQLAFGIDMAKQGLWNEALFRFKRASQLRPGDSAILNNMAVAYEAVGDFDQALESYKSALKSDPSNQELKRNYSRFVEFYQSFRPPEAAEKAAEEAGGEEAAASDSSRG